ncbi:MAG: MarR family transcriptional regulator [Proteobacteria bacterium]|nr:MarR family transcriptional regulator [Pseudomonadota bacterium]
MAKRSRLTEHDYEQLAEFRYQLRRFLTFSEAAAVEAGLTPQQHQALLAIKGFPGGNVATGQLSERLGIKHHSTVGLIDRLAAGGMVKRQTGETDRRQVFLVLTPKAEKLLAALSLAHRNELEKMKPLLRKFLRYLERG